MRYTTWGYFSPHSLPSLTCSSLYREVQRHFNAGSTNRLRVSISCNIATLEIWTSFKGTYAGYWAGSLPSSIIQRFELSFK